METQEVTTTVVKNMVRMYGPGGASWRGTLYELGKDGAVLVPAEALEELKSHGYTTEKPVVEKVEKDEHKESKHDLKKG